MATTAAPAPSPPEHRRIPPVRFGLLAAVMFVLGLLAGAVIVGLLGEDPVVVEGGGPAAEGEVPGGDLPPDGASAEFVVNAACLGAVNAAQDAFLVLDDFGEAAADLDAARLDEIVRFLIPLQDRLDEGLESCEVTAVVDGRAGEPTTVEPGEPLPTDVDTDDEPADEGTAETEPTGQPDPAGEADEGDAPADAD